MSSYNLTNRAADQSARNALKARQRARKIIEEIEDRKARGLPYREVLHGRK
ncbi:hypothetical protein [Aeromonas caviae]|uniref:hypothetical protein n=1 Tax=Aeromonas caviae TaxID=648 RepID=UPI002B48B36C|nr:hypothetical protein [Aeromonas caviae]